MNKTISKAPGKPTHAIHKNSPEIRDNLDARKNEEQDFKGDDVTHNRKPHHHKKQAKKKSS